METATQLATINTAQVAVIVDTAPVALQTNSTSVERALSAGQALLDTIQAEGMTPELDARCNSFLVKVKTTIEEMEGRRKPVTQIFDFIKSQFTALENTLSPKNKDSIYVQIQAARDKFATDQREEQRRKEQEAQRKLELDKELIRLKSEVQTQLSSHFNAFLNLRIQVLNSLYNELSLINFDATADQIKLFPVQYMHDQFNAFAPNARTIFASADQLQNIIIDCTKGKYGEFSLEFTNRLTTARSEIIDRLASRKSELQEIQRAEEAARAAVAAAKSQKEKQAAEQAAAQAAEMRALAERRKAEEETRLRQEEESRSAAAASKIATEAQAATTMSLFDAQQAVASAPETAPMRESYEIEVLNPLAYMLIASFYFEHEGKTESIAKLEKKTLGSMKKFCESYALKNDVKIESAFLKYNEKFKTVAKKSS